MTEILTESFCERCGTRYTFEPVQSKRRGLGKIGTLGRGFRHFVSDPGSSLDEAFAVAKSEQEQRSTTHALEAFHRTFNFCLNCRQYTCGDCWNAVEGRCLSCAPTAESLEPPATRMDTAVVLPPLDAAPSRVPLELEEDADLRNAGPWIGGTPEGEQQPVLDGAPELSALPELELPPLERLPEAEAVQELEREPLPDLASAEAIEARLAVSPTDDAISGIFDEPARAVERTEATAVEAEPILTEPIEAEAEPIAAEPIAAEAEQVTAAAEPVAPEPIEAEAEAIAATEADAAPAAADAIEGEAEPIAAEPEPTEIVAAEAEPVPEAVDTTTSDAGMAFEPGLNLDEQIAAYERRLAADRAQPAPAPEPVAPTEREAPESVREAIAPDEAPIPEPEPVAAEVERLAAEAEPVVAEAAPEPVAAGSEPEPEPVAAEGEPTAPHSPPVPERPEELPVAASGATPPARVEPIPTAIGTPLPASVVDGPLAWPNSDLAAAAFEQQWPDITVPRQPGSTTPPQPPQRAPQQPEQVQEPRVIQQATPPPPAAALRRTGANLPSVSAPPPVLAAHACPSCGLSLSASARFCRRCGTPQQVDAAR